MRKIFYVLIMIWLPVFLQAGVLYIGPGQSYQTLSRAAEDALPGDSIVFLAGVYSGGEYIADLQGTEATAIFIMAESPGSVVIRGGSNGWHLSDVAFLHISGLIFENQTGNGFNLDDGGDYSTPSHHITFDGCIFRDISATGNNDLLKMSGIDYFTIQNCIFSNGASGGSGIDMVGCHFGNIIDNHFENMGSNAIQAKGGTSSLMIEKNYFKNCGQRSINMGGSTGLQYFRPLDATYEAAEIHVVCNIFIGSEAPVAFVGCVRSSFVHNTIINPEKWVLRILQETVDPSRFELSGDNIFANNLIYKSNAVSTDCNIGPNTASETFTFSNNLWYNHEKASNSSPSSLPVTDLNNIIGIDPDFNDVDQEDYSISASSVAVGAGLEGINPERDFNGNLYNSPPSIGAFEGKSVISHSYSRNIKFEWNVYPNPASQGVRLSWDEALTGRQASLEIIDLSGQVIERKQIANHYYWNNTSSFTGVLIFRIKWDNGVSGEKKLIIF